jgi:hypothetical protein
MFKVGVSSGMITSEGLTPHYIATQGTIWCTEIWSAVLPFTVTAKRINTILSYYAVNDGKLPEEFVLQDNIGPGIEFKRIQPTELPFVLWSDLA